MLTVHSWSGGAGAGDTNWMTGANWVGGIAPSAGDTLIFPSGPTQTSTNNNFAPGTDFESISISGSGYTLAGNTLDLQNGLQVTADNTAVNTPLQLLADQTVSESTGTLTLGGATRQSHLNPCPVLQAA